MKSIAREQARKFAFDWRDEPLLRVEPGEPFEVETFDASNGYIRSAEDKAIPSRRPGFDRVPPLANPIAGPIWVEGAERGDALVVTIERDRRRRLFLDRDRPAARAAGRIDPLARTIGRIHDQDLPPHARSQRHDPRWHPPLRRASIVADHAVRRHARRRARPRGDHQHRRPGRMGRQPRHPRRGARQPDLPARSSTPGLSSTWATSTPARATPSSPARPPRPRPRSASGSSVKKGNRDPGHADRKAG